MLDQTIVLTLRPALIKSHQEPGKHLTTQHFIIKENISRNLIKVLIVSHGGDNRKDNQGGEREEGEAGVGVGGR